MDGVTGFLIPENDGSLLADRLRLLLEDSDLRTMMGRAARAHYEAHFTFDRLVNESLHLYESTVED